MPDRASRLHPVPMLLLLACGATSAFAIGSVEIALSSSRPTIDSEALEKLPVSRDLTTLANLVPNAAGVTRFAAEAGSYELHLRGDGGVQKFEIEEGTLSSYRYVPGQGLVRLDAPLPPTYEPIGGSTARGYAFDYRIENHALTLQLGTPYGTLYATGPEILQRGAPSTWTSAVFPAGESAREKARNTAALRDHELRIGGSGVVPPDGAAEIVLRESPQVLLSYRGKGVASGTIPTLFGDSSTAGVLNLTTRTPPVVFAGGPITLPGSFDGLGSSTRLTYDGRPLRIAAESPYAVTFYTPVDALGPGQVGITEGGQSWTQPVRSLGLEIWADQTDLLRGQSSVCHVKVSGLAGLEGSIELQLVNRTPGVIALAQGNQPLIQVDPNRLTRPDVLQIDRPFTGVQRGTFQIQATLLYRP